MASTAVQAALLVAAFWAAGAWIVTLVRRGLTDPLGWALATGAVVSWVAGEIVRLAPLAVGHPVGAPPSISNLLAGVWGLLIAIMTVRLAARVSRTARARFWLDSLMITSSLFVVGYPTLLAGMIDPSPGSKLAAASGLVRGAAFTHRAADLLMVAGVILLCSRLPSWRSSSMLYMLLGLSLVVGGDLIEFVARSAHWQRPAPLAAEACWALGAALFALNARLLRRQFLLGRQPVPSNDAASATRLGLTLPYMPLVGLLAFCGVRAETRTPWQATETWLAIIATLVVVGRQMLVLFDNRRLLAALREREQLLQHQAFHDPLTGLPNRLLFGERLQQAVTALPSATGLTVLFCDLDDFKRVNDNLGHAAGDELLEIAASRLQRCAPEGALVARLGGDEFAVLMGSAGSASEDVAASIMDAFHEPVELDGEPLLVVASIGIGRVDAGAVCTAEDLLTQADLAMLAAKNQGKGRYALFDPVMKPVDPRDRRLVNDFAEALRSSQVYPVYQPIVDLATGEIIGYEALARWKHPAKGPVPPDRFVKLAEATGQIGALTDAILTQALADHARWRELGGPTPYVSVNVSPSVLLRRDFLAGVAAALADGLPPESLVLELTDGQAVPDSRVVESLLLELRAMGVRLALDDFGSGHHILRNLRELPIDIIKIDRAIIAAAEDSARDEALLGSYLSLGRALGVAVIAEGVESASQAMHLQELGCAAAQGYLFSAPLTAAEITHTIGVQPAPAGLLPSPRSEPALADATARRPDGTPRFDAG